MSLALKFEDLQEMDLNLQVFFEERERNSARSIKRKTERGGERSSTQRQMHYHPYTFLFS
jgi:hypothetical protein